MYRSLTAKTVLKIKHQTSFFSLNVVLEYIMFKDTKNYKVNIIYFYY